MATLRLLSFGAGALGTYIGGSFALAGEAVVFLEQPAAVARLRAAGLSLDLSKDKRRYATQPEHVDADSLFFTDSLGEALDRGPFDAALFALKSFDTAAALERMQPFAAEMPPVCCFSNGIDNEPAIAAVLGPDKVIAATVTTAVGRRDAGEIVLEKLRGVGFATTHPLSQSLIAAANRAGLCARGFEDGRAMKWSKMLTNLIGNATSAILDMTPAAVLTDARLYELEIGMMRECLAVMRAQKIPVVDLPRTPVRALAWAAALPPRISQPLLWRAAAGSRGGKMPSFHIDLHSGRGRSEVEYLNGAVVRAGRSCGVPTPINQLLTDTLMAMTRGALGRDEFSGKPERLLAALSRS